MCVNIYIILYVSEFDVCNVYLFGFFEYFKN